MTEETAIILTDEQQEAFDYDELWKDFIADFWQEILKKFIPSLYKKADLNREPEFLDKELHDILASFNDNDSKTPKRYVDKLLKIFLKNGGEEWVLLHIEIQGKGGENFSLRMFRYYCLLFIHYGKNPTALAILTAGRPKREGDPGIYKVDLFGTSIEYKYNIVKAYALSDEELLSGDSLVDLFIYSVKIAAKYRKSDKSKVGYMKKIAKLLSDRGLDKEKRRGFIMYLERVMSLSDIQYRLEFREYVDTLFEERRNGVRYKGELELAWDAGKEEGLKAGKEEGNKEGIEKGIRQNICDFIKSGLLSDEQIAAVVKRPIEFIRALRREIGLA
ncbi:MAG: hypothetical protein IJT21_09535 [Synergistaceae bacterium]|nr:hypothetical protein [Synergistaceae bacterium]